MLWEEHPLARAAPLIHECLAAVAEDADHLVVITDANGVLLSVEGSPSLRLRAADHMNFTEGTLWSEPGAGTNAIGTAIAADHAVQVFGPEHFNEVVQRWTCSAAPIHDPDTGELLGVIDLTGDFSTVQPHSLAVATATAQAVEAWLRLQMQEHDLRLRARYGSQVAVAPGSRALVTPNGRPITDVPASWGTTGRLAIPPGGGRLTLPSGATAIAESVGPAEELFLVRAAERRTRPDPLPLARLQLLGRERALLEVNGHCTELRPRLGEILACSARTRGAQRRRAVRRPPRRRGSRRERARGGLAPAQAAGPVDRHRALRLTCNVETDVRRVEGLLRAGAVREAAEEYPGPLLADSEAPAIVEAREQLDAWMRQAVMTANNPGALWAWVNSCSGRDDLGAWKRLLAGLEYRDPRHSLCAARIGELRRSLT